MGGFGEADSLVKYYDRWRGRGLLQEQKLGIVGVRRALHGRFRVWSLLPTGVASVRLQNSERAINAHVLAVRALEGSV